LLIVFVYTAIHINSKSLFLGCTFSSDNEYVSGVQGLLSDW